MKYYSLNVSEIQRAEFWSTITCFDPSMLIWVDETGSDMCTILRRYGYGVRRILPRDFTVRMRGKHYSAIGILTNNGIIDVYIAEGSVNGEVFLDFVRKRACYPY